jgi:hypothetical protein
VESLLNDLAEFYEALDAVLQPTKQVCGPAASAAVKHQSCGFTRWNCRTSENL